MTLKPCPDDQENRIFHVLGSPEGVRMGVHGVMYGFRIRGWMKGSAGCFVDWCGGNDQSHMEKLYAYLKHILTLRGVRPGWNRDIPVASRIKPIFSDLDFLIKLSQLTGGLQNVKVEPLPKLPPLLVESWREDLVRTTEHG